MGKHIFILHWYLKVRKKLGMGGGGGGVDFVRGVLLSKWSDKWVCYQKSTSPRTNITSIVKKWYVYCIKTKINKF